MGPLPVDVPQKQSISRMKVTQMQGNSYSFAAKRPPTGCLLSLPPLRRACSC